MNLAGLPATAQVGLFAASPDYQQVSAHFGGGTSGSGGPTQATGVFDHLATAGGWTAGPWTGQPVGSPEVPGVDKYHQSNGQFTVTGQGDIAPIPAGHGGGPGDAGATVSEYLTGTFAGLIALVVVAAVFVTAEYRRGLIRLTFAADPEAGPRARGQVGRGRRGRVRRRAPRRGGRGAGGRRGHPRQGTL